MSNEKHAVVIFDGVCNFCNSSVNFIIRHDKKKYFRFTAIQSETGQRLMQQYNLQSFNLQTVILIEDDKFYTHSAAALRIARHLSGGWVLFYPFIFLPAFLRDIPYKLIAANRYRWFGKKEECLIPTADVRERFLPD